VLNCNSTIDSNPDPNGVGTSVDVSVINTFGSNLFNATDLGMGLAGTIVDEATGEISVNTVGISYNTNGEQQIVPNANASSKDVVGPTTVYSRTGAETSPQLGDTKTTTKVMCKVSGVLSTGPTPIKSASLATTFSVIHTSITYTYTEFDEGNGGTTQGWDPSAPVNTTLHSAVGPTLTVQSFQSP
jgi:hypothetical protein